MLAFEFSYGFYVVGLPDDEVEKAEGFKGEVGGGFFGSPDDEEEKAEGFIGEVGLRKIFFLYLS